MMRARVHGMTLGLLLISLPVIAADDLGRLFFTPEQRAQLDQARRTQPKATQSEGEAQDGVTLSGIVTRSDGRRTVWINGQPQSNAPGGSPTSATLPLPGGEGKIRLRVGQTLDPSSGKVEEGYRRPPKLEPATPATPPSPSKPPLRAPAKDDDVSTGDNPDNPR